MSDGKRLQSDNPEKSLEVLIDLYLNEAASDEQVSLLNERLRQDESARDLLLQMADIHANLHEDESLWVAQTDLATCENVHQELSLSLEASSGNHRNARPARTLLARRPEGFIAASAIGLGIAMAAMLLIAFWPVSQVIEPLERVAPAYDHPIFAGMFNAGFDGAESPGIGTEAVAGQTYTLKHGKTELIFPNQAEVLIEGPAVFRLLNESEIRLDHGQASVYAPESAHGFTVQTEEVTFIDRGTRFTVTAQSQGALKGASLHMVDGLVEAVDRKPVAGTQPYKINLTAKKAMRFSRQKKLVAEPIAFDPELYQSALPDRIVSYRASKNERGMADRLEDVTVQRDGRLLTIQADQLIYADEVIFRSTHTRRQIFPAGERLEPDPMFSDQRLNTGFYYLQPSEAKRGFLPSQDKMHRKSTRPLFELRFDEPVVNDSGPDLLVFELQDNREHQDQFYISGPDAIVHVVRVQAYDISVGSPEALLVGDLNYYTTSKMIDSVVEGLKDLKDLKDPKNLKLKVIQGNRCRAVAIDLSQMGIAPGEGVKQLLFWDIKEQESIFDPVLIAGLPALDRFAETGTAPDAQNQ